MNINRVFVQLFQLIYEYRSGILSNNDGRVKYMTKTPLKIIIIVIYVAENIFSGSIFRIFSLIPFKPSPPNDSQGRLEYVKIGRAMLESKNILFF